MAEDFSKDATVRELVRNESKAIRDSFTGVLKSVVPDVTVGLAKVARGFRDSLITGTDQRIQSSYNSLQKFLSTFDVEIGSLGKSFLDVEKAFKGLTKQYEIVNKEIENLREKNIVAEKTIVLNKKTNQLEVKATLMTDADLIKKRQEILKQEKVLKEKEISINKEITKFQKGEVSLDQRQRVNLLERRNVVQQEIQNTQELKQLYSGKGGRFDVRVGGAIDSFERVLQEKAPDFLVTALGPIIETARQFQKTTTLFIDGITSTGRFLSKFLPESFNKNFKIMADDFGKLFGSLKKAILPVIGSLVTFGKRIILTGITMLATIVAPLLPLLIPLLKFAGIIALVVGGLYLLKKGFDALTNWFKTSALGKLLGLDKDSEKREQEDKKKGTGKYQSLDEGTYDVMGDEQSKKKEEKPKVLSKEQKEAFGGYEKPKVIAAEEPQVTKIEAEKPKVIAEKPLMPVEEEYTDEQRQKDLKTIQDMRKGSYGKRYGAVLKDLQEEGAVIPQTKAQAQQIGIGGKEYDEYLAKKLKENEEKGIDPERIKSFMIQQERMIELGQGMNEIQMGGERPEFLKKMEAEDKQAEIDFQKQLEKEKKELGPIDTSKEGQVIINNVTAPQNVASSSTQQVVAANSAKSNDDSFLNLNRYT